MNTKSTIGLAVLALGLLILSNSVYIVNEIERAVLLRFGKVVDFDTPPGLHFKIPGVHKVIRFDARVLTSDAKPERYLTSEKKPVIVDSFIKWRIAEDGVDKFYKATTGGAFPPDEMARRLIASRVSDGLRNQFGERSMREVVSGERDELMTELTRQVNGLTSESLGIEVIDIRVKRIDLPPEVSSSVYQRMNTERQREAREYRSQGREQAEVIQADADRQRTILEAEAYREAELIRGAGDAQAASIYANAYNQDPEFYSFYRSLNAYKETFNNRGDIIVLEPDSDFFQYMNGALTAAPKKDLEPAPAPITNNIDDTPPPPPTTLPLELEQIQ